MILSTATFKKAPRGPRSRQKRSKKPEFCLPPPPKKPRASLEVDKNGVKCLDFVYRHLQKDSARRHRSRQKQSKMPWFCLPPPPKKPRAGLNNERNSRFAANSLDLNQKWQDSRFPENLFSIVYKEQMLTVFASGFHDALINLPCLASSHNIAAWTHLTTSSSSLHNLTVYFSLHNIPFYNISSSFNIPATSLHNTIAPPHTPHTRHNTYHPSTVRTHHPHS